MMDLGVLTGGLITLSVPPSGGLPQVWSRVSRLSPSSCPLPEVWPRPWGEEAVGLVNNNRKLGVFL